MGFALFAMPLLRLSSLDADTVLTESRLVKTLVLKAKRSVKIALELVLLLLNIIKSRLTQFESWLYCYFLIVEIVFTSGSGSSLHSKISSAILIQEK